MLFHYHYHLGPIVVQKRCAVDANDTPDTLKVKVQALEGINKAPLNRDTVAILFCVSLKRNQLPTLPLVSCGLFVGLLSGGLFSTVWLVEYGSVRRISPYSTSHHFNRGKGVHFLS